MNLKDFYYFLDLSQQQSFTGVAQKHGISQPSISYAIKRLEKEFHCQLIAHDPSHRTFKLTPQGEILLRHIQNILRLVVRKSPTGESTHYFFFMLK